MEPLPGYVGAFAIAGKLGLPVTKLEDVDSYWIAAAEVMLEAERIERERREQQREAR